ncbi:claudin-12 isoform X4 [Austrofundulus limnaeus]|uniref:Claudin-12 isoform X4 n=1 Tax=Austrofundulus limnaeus TaxID=52670 RepID=A0A2I4AJR8_AUSLI|nr:PREDICTED: claudin-12 isoform X4 [Austrofundulus limnaeus]
MSCRDIHATNAFALIVAFVCVGGLVVATFVPQWRITRLVTFNRNAKNISVYDGLWAKCVRQDGYSGCYYYDSQWYWKVTVCTLVFQWYCKVTVCTLVFQWYWKVTVCTLVFQWYCKVKLCTPVFQWSCKVKLCTPVFQWSCKVKLCTPVFQWYWKVTVCTPVFQWYWKVTVCTPVFQWYWKVTVCTPVFKWYWKVTVCTPVFQWSCKVKLCTPVFQSYCKVKLCTPVFQSYCKVKLCTPVFQWYWKVKLCTPVFQWYCKVKLCTPVFQWYCKVKLCTPVFQWYWKVDQLDLRLLQFCLPAGLSFSSLALLLGVAGMCKTCCCSGKPEPDMKTTRCLVNSAGCHLVAGMFLFLGGAVSMAPSVWFLFRTKEMNSRYDNIFSNGFAVFVSLGCSGGLLLAALLMFLWYCMCKKLPSPFWLPLDSMSPSPSAQPLTANGFPPSPVYAPQLLPAQTFPPTVIETQPFVPAQGYVPTVMAPVPAQVSPAAQKSSQPIGPAGG